MSLGTERSVDEVLHDLVAGTASAIGEDFFRALVRHLADALGVGWAFVSEVAGHERVRALAFWSPEGYVEGVEYDLPGTPCERVLAGETRLYPTNVAQLFPGEPELAEMGAESYLAMPLIADGKVMGHLAIIDAKPFYAEPREMSIFRIFGARVAAELARLRMEAALRASEGRLSAILRTATDAILTFDGERRIVLINRSAERLLGCDVGAAVGKPLARFLSEPLREAVERSLVKGIGGGDKAQVWLPEGFNARRADGVELPVEGTVSGSEDGGELLYTLILRDLRERRLAEQRLRRLLQERDYLEEEIRTGAGGELLYASPAMAAVMDLVQRVADTDSTVLLTGETGVGKEVIARALHQASRRRERPLIKLNCAALPSALVESELFGHEKGAFSGAIARRIGRFELANGGTLFLDEVGELSLAAQAKLLRVLQEGELERVGGSETIRTDARVVAATNRNLQEMVASKTFREDLYYRLSVFPIQIPPLRERQEDIPLLARAFLAKLARRLGKPFSGIAEASLAGLLAYGWPGNVRELHNVVERAAILTNGPLVEVTGLTPRRGDGPVPSSARSLEEAQRAHIQAVLEETGWTVEGPTGAAAVLGLAPSTLRSKMQRLKIERRG